MMKQLYDEHENQTYLTHLAEDRSNYLNSLLFDYHKTIDPTEETPQEEDSPEDSLEEGDSPEVEDSLEEEDTQEEAAYHREAHPEAHGEHRHYTCNKHNKERW